MSSDPVDGDVHFRRHLVVPILVAGAASFYWWYAYSGPYAWLADRLDERFGGYRPKLVFGTVFAATFAAAAGLVVVVRWLDRNRAPWARSAAPTAAPTAEPAARVSRRRLQAVVLAGVGLSFVGVGARDLLRAARHAEPVAVDVARLEAGDAPPGEWVELTGVRASAPAVDVEEAAGGQRAYVRVSATPPDDVFAPPVATHVFVRVDRWRNGPGGTHAVLRTGGFVSTDGLPGQARRAFKQLGVLDDDDRNLVVEADTNPLKLKVSGWGSVAIGGAIAAIQGLILWRERRAARAVRESRSD